MKLNNSYPDVIINAFKSVQAWRSLALLLMGVLLFETVALGWLANQRSVVLVPQHLANHHSSIELNLGAPFSPDYITGVAKGDAWALLNWTPDNIEQQYASFLARLVPALHDAQRQVLLDEVKQHRDDGLTQSFYVTHSVVEGSSVLLVGVLVRAMGGREVYRGPAAYQFTYSNVGNGLLMVSGVKQPTEEEQRTLLRSAGVSLQQKQK